MLASFEASVYVHQPSVWTRMIVWWSGRRTAITSSPYLGPGHRQPSGKRQKISVPPRPIPRDCSAIWCRTRSAAAVCVADLAHIPWQLFRPSATQQLDYAARLIEVPAAKFRDTDALVPADAAATEADIIVAMTVGEIMQRLITALEAEPIFASPNLKTTRPARSVPIMAKRLAVVAKLNRPIGQKQVEQKASRPLRARPALQRPEANSKISTKSTRKISSAPDPKLTAEIEAIVASAANNVINFITASKKLGTEAAVRAA